MIKLRKNRRAVVVTCLAVAAMVVGLSPPAAAQTYGTITAKLNCPGSAIPGQVITVSGEGFVARGIVTFHWDGSTDILTSATADPLGLLSHAVTVPPLAKAGTHELSAKGKGKHGGPLVLKCKIKVVVSLPLSGQGISSTREPSSGLPPVPVGVGAFALGLVALSLARARHRRRDA